jgi:hypothetical protein
MAAQRCNDERVMGELICSLPFALSKQSIVAFSHFSVRQWCMVSKLSK